MRHPATSLLITLTAATTAWRLGRMRGRGDVEADLARTRHRWGEQALAQRAAARADHTPPWRQPAA